MDVYTHVEPEWSLFGSRQTISFYQILLSEGIQNWSCISVKIVTIHVYKPATDAVKMNLKCKIPAMSPQERNILHPYLMLHQSITCIIYYPARLCEGMHYVMCMQRALECCDVNHAGLHRKLILKMYFVLLTTLAI